MFKYYVMLVVALLGLTSESQAAKPFIYSPLTDGPSVLTATQAESAPAPVAAPAEAAAAAVVEARPDAPEQRQAAESAPASVPPAPADPAPVAPTPSSGEQSAAVPATVEVQGDGSAPEAVATESNQEMQASPVYRSSRGYRPMYGGVLGELIELERRKNAWIRRNVFGR